MLDEAVAALDAAAAFTRAHWSDAVTGLGRTPGAVGSVESVG